MLSLNFLRTMTNIYDKISFQVFETIIMEYSDESYNKQFVTLLFSKKFLDIAPSNQAYVWKFK